MVPSVELLRVAGWLSQPANHTVFASSHKGAMAQDACVAPGTCRPSGPRHVEVSNGTVFPSGQECHSQSILSHRPVYLCGKVAFGADEDLHNPEMGQLRFTQRALEGKEGIIIFFNCWLTLLATSR
jgi:hypothetical protein